MDSSGEALLGTPAGELCSLQRSDSGRQTDWAAGWSDGSPVGGVPAGGVPADGNPEEYGVGYSAELERRIDLGSALGSDVLDADSAEPADKVAAVVVALAASAVHTAVLAAAVHSAVHVVGLLAPVAAPAAAGAVAAGAYFLAVLTQAL